MYSESSMGTLSFGIPDIVLGVLLRMVLGIAADTDLRMGIAALGFALDIAYRIPVCTLLHTVFEFRFRRQDEGGFPMLLTVLAG